MHNSCRLQRQQKVIWPNTTSNILPDTFFLRNKPSNALLNFQYLSGVTLTANKSLRIWQPKARTSSA